MPKSLFGRSMAIMLVPLFLVQASAMYVLYDRHYTKLTASLAESIVGDLAALRFMVLRSETPSEEEEIFALTRWTMKLLPSLDFGSLGIDAPVQGRGVLNRQLGRFMNEQGWTYVIDSVSDPREVLFYIDLPERESILSVKVSKDRLFTSTVYIFAFWLIGASIILFGVATIFMRNQVRPIRRLARAAELFGKGQDVPSFRLEGASEVRQASASFLTMRARVNRFMRQRTQMLSGVSHDLRTPLTRMKLQLALMKQDEDVESLGQDVSEMEAMVESYLAFARGDETEESTSTEIATLIEDLVQRYRSDQQPVSLTIAPNVENLEIPLRQQNMRRAIGNLIGNALKYAHRAEVNVNGLKDFVEILVDDDGPGIPASERDAVLQPFYRMESSRNTETGGMGLGLSIAADIVQGHGGTMFLEDAPLGGLRARVRLPL